MTSCLVREATGDDLTALQTLFSEENRYHAELVPGYVRESKQVLSQSELGDFMSRDDHLLLIAEDRHGGIPLGALIASVLDYGHEPWLVRRRVAYLDELIVTARGRRRGVGRSLLDHMHTWARVRRLSEIELHVWAANEVALSFYAAMGFETTRHTLRADVPEIQAQRT